MVIIKIFFITILSILFLLIASCAQNQQIICNKPYILVGNSCCLDKNNNNVCDKDEEKTKEEVTCDKPYIKVGNNCCLDKNDNKICDSDEKEITTSTSEEKSNFSIADLQSDINKVLNAPVLLVKDFNTNKFQVYSDTKISNVKFLGKYGEKSGYGSSNYFKLITKKPVMVIQIGDKDSYLKDYNHFYDFVRNNKNIFIESAIKSKEIFENEFKNGELPRLIFLKNRPREASYAETAKYTDHQEISSKLFFDNITFPETVSKRIAQIFYVRVNKYEVNISYNSSYHPKGEIIEGLSNINLAYNMIVYCNPSIVIILNEECFGQGTYFCQGTGYSHDLDFDDSDVDATFFLTNLRSYYDPYTRFAQALIDMCDQKYKFSFIKDVDYKGGII